MLTFSLDLQSMFMFTHSAHNTSALTHNSSLHEDRRAGSQCTRQQSNLCN